jgi:hypothetical protein
VRPVGLRPGGGRLLRCADRDGCFVAVALRLVASRLDDTGSTCSSGDRDALTAWWASTRSTRGTVSGPVLVQKPRTRASRTAVEETAHRNSRRRGRMARFGVLDHAIDLGDIDPAAMTNSTTSARCNKRPRGQVDLVCKRMSALGLAAAGLGLCSVSAGESAFSGVRSNTAGTSGTGRFDLRADSGYSCPSCPGSPGPIVRARNRPRVLPRRSQVPMTQAGAAKADAGSP